ncbi:hypothetical protein PF005_g19933 [Phytophthora fragariae]|uniref:RxLR effector protein n=2 Tax=Phytophthora TaxID=4783 RepID=A0A6A3I8T8_9STRA|nr:hypothetical protein PF003_g7313 [Phytophthora fragariae]KAE8987828.1 hypothetical protein PR001_g22211 [Phytophthora rubi]KAE8944073.1 hypothetical protein PF009_g6252 [Phytophthora fragariae]KAE8979246.1 hypothetical protein PF011_g22928 [Phytophthora fragariae]KAE8989235.1 hypothetical protein PR002_g21511 [Phytophthora rubi]
MLCVSTFLAGCVPCFAVRVPYTGRCSSKMGNGIGLASPGHPFNLSNYYYHI